MCFSLVKKRGRKNQFFLFLLFDLKEEEGLLPVVCGGGRDFSLPFFSLFIFPRVFGEIFSKPFFFLFHSFFSVTKLRLLFPF